MSRHSPHSEALSCCSRGNRSNKSGSSFNRDSGGSSGHYTHQSEPAPCCNQPPDAIQGEFRRDSGSSTQHSGNSYFAYGIPPLGFDVAEKADEEEADCLLNFTTAEVPEAFQDDYEGGGRTADGRFYEDARSSARQTVLYFEEKAREGAAYGQNVDLSPPGLGVFKRQKCLRLKQRGRSDDRRPILRSKSDISDRWVISKWRQNGFFQIEKLGVLVGTGAAQTVSRAGRSATSRKCSSWSDSSIDWASMRPAMRNS